MDCLIWTTTPWTIPANLAISFNPKFEYVVVDTPEGLTIVAEGLLKQVSEALGWDATVVAKFPGSKLDRAVFRHPFLDRDSLGLVGDHVTLEQGTGAVHTAPGHGQEDFVIGQRYGLPVYCPVDAAGRIFRAEGASGMLPDEIVGKTIWDINPIIIEILEKHGALAGQSRLEHSYPHCWRCHRPVIFRATEQWFIGMDRESLRSKALHAIKHVQWHPSWGEERIGNMVASRPDWCISRQRVWGVPIIVFYCEACSEPFTNRQVQQNVLDNFRQNTSDVWYSESVEQLMGLGCACSKCGGTSFRKENDILDVWFDSGSSHLAVLTEKNGLHWPADMYIEGGDQYRGWFQSSLLIGTGLRGGSPFRACATHGWTLDEQGRAMHKSLGNTIEPEKIIKQYGADLLRLWVGSVDFTEDVRLSDTILKRLSEAYRKIRNTFKVLLGNLHDFDPAQDQLPGEQLTTIDVWMLTEAEELVRLCVGYYDELAFHKVYRAVYDFVITRVSALFVDVSKDRLYTALPAGQARRSAQTAAYRMLSALVRLLAPVLSFTCEEVWSYFKLDAGATSSVHMTNFPKPEELTAGISAAQRERSRDWQSLLPIRDQVLKALDGAREEKVIGSSLEAAVTLGATGETLALLERQLSDLPMWFIVSQVAVNEGGSEGLDISIERARGDKCERCWKYTDDVGRDPRVPTVCAACAAVLDATGYLD